MSQSLTGAARWITGLELGAVVLVAPLLLFPTFRPVWTVGALVVLVVVWLLRWLGTGRPGAATPLDVSLLLLVLTIPIAVWASALPALTLPKLTGLILGVAAFRATVNAVDRPRKLSWAVALYLVLGLCLAVLGLVGTHWYGKLQGLAPLLAPVLGRIPQLVRGLPGAEAGINANELGGALVLFLPVSLAATLALGGLGRQWIDWLVRLASFLATFFIAGVLVLTQSRSAWMGAAVGLGTMAWLRWRWARWLILGGALAMMLALWYVGPGQVAQALLQPAGTTSAGTVLGAASLEGRVELWNRALFAIQDFPFTGCGLGTFRRVVNVLYPLFLAGPDADLAHAHNVFLQVALDLGLPGLVAYLGMVGTAIWICWRLTRPLEGSSSRYVARSPGDGSALAGGAYRWLALGIVGSLVAFHVYGLTDAIALGAKPGVALWILLALAAALWSTMTAARPAAAADAAGMADPVCVADGAPKAEQSPEDASQHPELKGA